MNRGAVIATLGITSDQFARLLDRGLPVEPDGEFDLEKVRAWLAEHRQPAAEDEPKDR